MRYQNIVPGRFLSRPNRFIAHIEINGKVEICHVKNTGRCKELLTPGAQVWCEKSDNPARKTLRKAPASSIWTPRPPMPP